MDLSLYFTNGRALSCLLQNVFLFNLRSLSFVRYFLFVFFLYRKFSDYSRVITDIYDLFIETTDVGDLKSETY